MSDTALDLDMLAATVGQIAQYPSFGVDVQESHANLVISYGPGHYLVQAVTAEQMDGLCQAWLGRHRQSKDE